MTASNELIPFFWQGVNVFSTLRMLCTHVLPFMSRFSAEDVHRIGILDLRLFNTDRHSGNLLVNQTEDKNESHPWLARRVDLIPIDHGFCLPEALEPPYFEWMHWPQVKAETKKQKENISTSLWSSGLQCYRCNNFFGHLLLIDAIILLAIFCCTTWYEI